jgi:hypothetical protein
MSPPLSLEFLYVNTVAVSADHETRPRPPLALIGTVPGDLHALYRLLAVVARW